MPAPSFGADEATRLAYVESRMTAEQAAFDKFYADYLKTLPTAERFANPRDTFRDAVHLFCHESKLVQASETWATPKFPTGKAEKWGAVFRSKGAGPMTGKGLKAERELARATQRKLDKMTARGPQAHRGQPVTIEFIEDLDPGSRAGFHGNSPKSLTELRGDLVRINYTGARKMIAVRRISRLDGEVAYIRVTAHELGHDLELQNLRLKGLRKAYIKKRVEGVPTETTFTKSGKPVKLYKADFIEEYCGAEYGPYEVGVEFTSVGTEWMLVDPYELSLVDPDHFRFMLMMFRGVVSA